jgi:hypothetical protein
VVVKPARAATVLGANESTMHMHTSFPSAMPSVGSVVKPFLIGVEHLSCRTTFPSNHNQGRQSVSVNKVCVGNVFQGQPDAPRSDARRT